MAPQIAEIEAVEVGVLSDYQWQTILYNCDCHEFEEVVQQLVKAVGCNRDTASHLAQIAHNFGSATVFKGTRESCERVANILGSIGLLVKVVPLY